VRKGLTALALVFLTAHLLSLPPTLDDIDSINFAMGVRDFDVAHHQPHPPGYPLFIALGKVATFVFRVAGSTAPEVRGLAVWSALAGSILIALVYLFWRRLDGDERRATMAAILTATCPLFWFTALRPLSDMTGLAFAVAALATLAAAVATIDMTPERRMRLLAVGACLAGLSTGFRSQSAVLTLPLLAYALLWPRPGFNTKARVTAIGAAAAGVLLWAVPLVVASGGPRAYLHALGSQAGEDFSGVVMLWTHRTPKVAVFALLHTFVLPWDSPILAGVVLALAAAGAWVLVRRAPRTLALIFLTFGPYAVFHLLFQETITVRYALPLMLPIAYLAATAIAEAGTVVSCAGTAAIAIVSLWLAVPAGLAFGRTPSPVFDMLSRMQATAETAPIVGMHRRAFTESRRARQWTGLPRGRLLDSPRDYEWLELTKVWREGGESTRSWFVADPRRTDLALIDSRGRRSESFRWPFNDATYVGGARPNELDWYTYDSPGWFLERGWSLTPETAGITERDGWGPHRRPSEGWVRRRDGETVMMIGGRHLGGAADPPVNILVSIDDRRIVTFTVKPGFFLDFHALPAGTLSGSGIYRKLTITAENTNAGETPRVALEQFDLQAPDAVQFGFDEGWQEPEYNPDTARSWRWMSERATIRVHNAGRPVVLRLTGESPLRYYPSAPTLTVSAGGQRLGEFHPDRDFTYEVPIPAAAIAGDGRLTLESSAMFIPGNREGTADRRHLAIRMYGVEVR
jgi:hypothetical protein